MTKKAQTPPTTPPAQPTTPPAGTPPAPPPSGISLDSIINDALKGSDTGIPNTQEPPPVAPAPVTPPPPAAAADEPPAAPPAPPTDASIPQDLLGKLLGTDDVSPKPPAADGDEPADPSDATPSGKKFAELRKELKEERRSKAGIEVKLKELEAKLGNPDATKVQLDKLEKQHQEVLSSLERANLEAHPSFKTNIAEPLQSVRDEFASLSKQYSLNRGELDEAMSKADPVERRKAVHELAEAAGLPAYEVVELQQKVTKYVDLSNKRDILLQRAKEANETLSTREREDRAVEKNKWAAESEKALDDAWPEFISAFPFPLKSETDEAWNTEVDKIHAIAKKVSTSNLSHMDRARIAHQAVALPFVLQKVLIPQLRTLAKKNQELEAALQKYQGGTPGVGSGGGSPPAAPAAKTLAQLIESL